MGPTRTSDSSPHSGHRRFSDRGDSEDDSVDLHILPSHPPPASTGPKPLNTPHISPPKTLESPADSFNSVGSSDSESDSPLATESSELLNDSTNPSANPSVNSSASTTLPRPSNGPPGVLKTGRPRRHKPAALVRFASHDDEMYIEDFSRNSRHSRSARAARNRADSFSDSSDPDAEDEIEIDLFRTSRPRRPPPVSPLYRALRTAVCLLFIALLGYSAYMYSRTGSSGSSGHSGHSDPSNPSKPSNPSVPSEPSNPPAALSNGTHSFRPTTIVISLDGFHPHYVSHTLTPHLHKLLTERHGAPFLTPAFPSSTFPNHWTMVTGLLPASHGIVANQFYDSARGKTFVSTDSAKSLDPAWWGGEPVWATAARHGVKTAIHMWPGSEVPGTAKGLEVDPFNGTEPLSRKTERIRQWLDRDVAERPQLMLLYVPTVDSVGHKFGISGPELEAALAYVDGFISEVFSELEGRNLTEIVNVVIVSDHGMSPTDNSRLIYLDDLISDMSNVAHRDGWPLCGLRPAEGVTVAQLESDVAQHLLQIPDAERHVRLFNKSSMPPEFQYTNGVTDKYASRIAPLWLIPDEGYAITTHAEMRSKHGNYTPKGIHGYNNTEVLMRALFVASGPFFDAAAGSGNGKFVPFRNTEIYNLICGTLGIPPAPNDGKWTDPASFGLRRLPDDWEDVAEYPGVNFDVSVVDVEATVDKMWGSGRKSGRERL